MATDCQLIVGYFKNNEQDDEIHRLQPQGILKQITAMLMPSLLQTKLLFDIVNTSPESSFMLLFFLCAVSHSY